MGMEYKIFRAKIMIKMKKTKLKSQIQIKMTFNKLIQKEKLVSKSILNRAQSLQRMINR